MITDVNGWAIGVATVAGFVLSFGYYLAFGTKLAELSSAYTDPGRPPAWKMLTELARTLVVATVLAGLVAGLELDLAGALLLGLVLWVAFPVVLLVGSAMWEKVPVRLATIHAGDWLVKLLLVAAIIGAWQ